MITNCDLRMNHGLTLGYPLDLLLCRDNRPADYSSDGSNPSIFLPDDNSPGTGNIVIRGRPGTGKSTLALQISVATCLQTKGKYCSAYFSLEEKPEHLRFHAESFGWGNYLRPLIHLHSPGDNVEHTKLAEILKKVLSQPDDCPMLTNENRICNTEHFFSHEGSLGKPGCVLLPSLSPRALSLSDEDSSDIFWQRFEQLEYLLKAGRTLREQEKQDKSLTDTCKFPDLRVVCIDSMNVFGNKLLSREEIFRIFDLFKRYQVIGIVIVEEDEHQVESPDSRLHGDTIEYLADMVIALKNEADKGYFIRYLEIVKSRYQHQVYGKHPFKIGHSHKNTTTDLFTSWEKNSIENYSRNCGITIFPSLHYIMYATEKMKAQNDQNEFDFGIKEMSDILPPNFKSPSIVLIEGPRSTFKSTLGINFLLSGICDFENVLLIRLNENLVFTENRKFRISEQLSHFLDWGSFTHEEINARGKLSKVRYQRHIYQNDKKGSKSLFVEVAFKSGSLFPEEFLDEVRQICQEANNEGYPIKRVVLDDVSFIGVSYPLLKDSENAGDLFLTAFAHIMRNEEISVVITGTTKDYKESDTIVEKARVLADTVIICDFCDVFGDRYVTISGDGLQGRLSAKKPNNDFPEFVPGVIVPRNIIDENYQNQTEIITIDLHQLDGLVGFSSGKVTRPGLTFRTFEENSNVHQPYNDDVESIITAAFGVDSCVTKTEDRPLVRVERFNPIKSRAMHDSLGILGGRPIDSTVVSSVDEFWMCPEKGSGFPGTENRSIIEDTFIPLDEHTVNYNDYLDTFYLEKSKIFSVPYYANVMVIAVRRMPHDHSLDSEIGHLIHSSLASNAATVSWDGYGRFKAWDLIHKFILEYYQIMKGNINVTNGFSEMPVWADRFAPETLACLAIDALVSAAQIEKKFEIDEIGDVLDGPDLRKEDIKRGNRVLNILQSIPVNAICEKEYGVVGSAFEELTALQKILELSEDSERQWGKTNSSKENEDGELQPNAGVYICWFSQLRSMIEKYPVLSEQLDIFALPGRGFRGDWYVGIVRGSVSTALGKQLVKTVCSDKEEYKRFSAGVGLPTRKSFYFNPDGEPTKYFAWPRSRYVSLRKMQLIHRNALTRKTIAGYTSFRQNLYILCKQLLRETFHDVQDDMMPKIFSRLPEQIESLTRG
jgi:KaiC/GvpD/RAD55 family RecA-like ATPase